MNRYCGSGLGAASWHSSRGALANVRSPHTRVAGCVDVGPGEKEGF